MLKKKNSYVMQRCKIDLVKRSNRLLSAKMYLNDLMIKKRR